MVIFIAKIQIIDSDAILDCMCKAVLENNSNDNSALGLVTYDEFRKTLDEVCCVFF